MSACCIAIGAVQVTFLQLLKTFEGDLELVLRVERGGVVFNLDTEE